VIAPGNLHKFHAPLAAHELLVLATGYQLYILQNSSIYKCYLHYTVVFFGGLNIYARFLIIAIKRGSAEANGSAELLTDEIC